MQRLKHANEHEAAGTFEPEASSLDSKEQKTWENRWDVPRLHAPFPETHREGSDAWRAMMAKPEGRSGSRHAPDVKTHAAFPEVPLQLRAEERKHTRLVYRYCIVADFLRVETTEKPF